jgi:hypothetical protein
MAGRFFWASSSVFHFREGKPLDLSGVTKVPLAYRLVLGLQ